MEAVSVTAGSHADVPAAATRGADTADTPRCGGDSATRGSAAASATDASVNRRLASARQQNAVTAVIAATATAAAAARASTPSRPAETALSSAALGIAHMPRGVERLSRFPRQPASPSSPASHALTSTAVPVQRLFGLPTSLYTHSLASSPALCSGHQRHGGEVDGVFSVSSASGGDVAPAADMTVDALEERVRRAAELHASGCAGDEAVVAGGTAHAVRVVRGYRLRRTSVAASWRGTHDEVVATHCDVVLPSGSRRRRRLERSVSAAGVRLDQYHAGGQDHSGAAIAAVSAQWVTSPSASSSSSTVFASPQPPLMAPVAGSVGGVSAVAPRRPAAPSPFGPLLDSIAAGHAPAAPPHGAAPAARRASPPPWALPWLSRAMSRGLAVQLRRDADAADAVAGPPSVVPRSARLALPLVSAPTPATVVAAPPPPPCTLRTALLRIFGRVAQLEADVAAAVAVVAVQSAGLSRSSPSLSPAGASPDPLSDQLRGLTRQWCEVLQQWPGEASLWGYVEWWLRHPAWALLSTAPEAAEADTDTRDDDAPIGGCEAGKQQQQQRQEQRRTAQLKDRLVTATGETMRTILDALVDAVVRAVGDALHGIATHSPASMVSQATCLELLRLMLALYASPPAALQPHLQDVRYSAAVAAGDDSAALQRDGTDAVASPGSLAGAVAGRPPPLMQPSSPSSGRRDDAPPDSPSSPAQSHTWQLHYQLLYAVCHLCSELPLPSSPPPLRPGSGRGVELPEDVDGVSPGSMDTSHTRHRGHSEAASLSSSPLLVLFAAAAQLAAAVSAVLVHVQLPMKGDLLCVASRLSRLRTALLRLSCLSEREYAAAMGHLGAVMAHAT
ncbi:hypothetical protein NESM_000853800 [Novymonas esmeraldas]|uniref:Uncharacterized protein n=1 Tax=Novymonas esmeraldas TaxID=1808958 RepID=A0AAW0F1E3_9TRYP